MDRSFTADWSPSRVHWPELFEQLGLLGPGLRFLEIGCFEGQATCWLLDYTDAAVTVIDPFRVERDGVPQLTRFRRNIAGTLPGRFDLVYVDGSHDGVDVLADAALAWPLLADRGLLLFDDYHPEQYPGLVAAVDGFVAVLAASGVAHAAEPVGPDQFLVARL